MKSLRPITIVGGGLAGLTLGIGLRRWGIPVTVWEAGYYPRHRVCGEFISGRGQDVLVRLGLKELLTQEGAILSHSAIFFLGDAESPVHPVEPPALCLSRFHMDPALARHFRALGGELRENARWDGDPGAEGIVLANGRRPQAVEDGWRWFGLKVHARGAGLRADLDMHGTVDGYVGLSRLPGDEINICGLFRAKPGHAAGPPKDLLRGMPGSSLHERLADAVFDEDSFCSVAGLRLRPQRALDRTQWRLGDALTMIPPVTGNGMSMAFEAAEITLEPLAAYSQGQLSWLEAKESAALACDAAFRQRLVWARWLQVIMLSPIFRGKVGGLLLGSEWLWNFLFARTR